MLPKCLRVANFEYLKSRFTARLPAIKPSMPQGYLHGVVMCDNCMLGGLKIDAITWSSDIRKAVALCNDLMPLSSRKLVGPASEKKAFTDVEAAFVVRVLSCPAMPCPVPKSTILPCLCLLCPFLLCPALPWPVPTSTILTVHCSVLFCPALPCPCPALPCPALPCPSLPCPALPYLVLAECPCALPYLVPPLQEPCMLAQLLPKAAYITLHVHLWCSCALPLLLCSDSHHHKASWPISPPSGHLHVLLCCLCVFA